MHSRLFNTPPHLHIQILIFILLSRNLGGELTTTTKNIRSITFDKDTAYSCNGLYGEGGSFSDNNAFKELPNLIVNTTRSYQKLIQPLPYSTSNPIFDESFVLDCPFTSNIIMAHVQDEESSWAIRYDWLKDGRLLQPNATTSTQKNDDNTYFTSLNSQTGSLSINVSSLLLGGKTGKFPDPYILLPEIIGKYQCILTFTYNDDRSITNLGIGNNNYLPKLKEDDDRLDKSQLLKRNFCMLGPLVYVSRLGCITASPSVFEPTQITSFAPKPNFDNTFQDGSVTFSDLAEDFTIEKVAPSPALNSAVTCLYNFIPEGPFLTNTLAKMAPKIRWYKDGILIEENQLMRIPISGLDIHRFINKSVLTLLSYDYFTIPTTTKDIEISLFNHTVKALALGEILIISTGTTSKSYTNLHGNYKCQIDLGSNLAALKYNSQQEPTLIRSIVNQSLPIQAPFFTLKPLDVTHELSNSAYEKNEKNYENEYLKLINALNPFTTPNWRRNGQQSGSKPITSTTPYSTGSDLLGIPCVFQGNPPPSVIWLKNGLEIKTPYSSSSYNVSFDTWIRTEDKYYVFNSPQSHDNDASSLPVGFSVLYLKLNKITDSGIVTCRLSNSEDSIDTSIRLKILASPRMIIEPAKLETVDVNGDLTLSCLAIGNPKPVIHWLKDGKLIPIAPSSPPPAPPTTPFLRRGVEFTAAAAAIPPRERRQSIAPQDYVRIDNRFNPRFLSRFYTHALRDPITGRVPVSTDSLVNLIRSYSTLSRLHILGAVPSDTGFYQCFAASGSGYVPSQTPRLADPTLENNGLLDQDSTLLPDYSIFGWTFLTVANNASDDNIMCGDGNSNEPETVASKGDDENLPGLYSKPRLTAHLSLGQSTDRAIALEWKIYGSGMNSQDHSSPQISDAPVPDNDIRIILLYGPTYSDRRRKIELKNPYKISSSPGNDFTKKMMTTPPDISSNRDTTTITSFGGKIWVTRLTPGTEYLFELRANYLPTSNVGVKRIGTMARDLIIVSTLIANTSRNQPPDSLLTSTESRKLRADKGDGNNKPLSTDNAFPSQNLIGLQSRDSSSIPTSPIPNLILTDDTTNNFFPTNIKAWATSSTSVKIIWDRPTAVTDTSLILYTVYVKRLGSALVYYYYLSKRRSKALLDNLKHTDDNYGGSHFGSNPSPLLLDLSSVRGRGGSRIPRNLPPSITSSQKARFSDTLLLEAEASRTLDTFPDDIFGRGGNGDTVTLDFQGNELISLDLENDRLSNLPSSSAAAAEFNLMYDGAERNSPDDYTAELPLIDFDTDRDEEMINIRGTANWYHATNLKPFTYYSVRVAVHDLQSSRTYVGPGPRESPVIIRTFSDVPGAPPSNITLRALSATKLSVSWAPPPLSSLNGVLTGYKIRYKISSLKHNEFVQYRGSNYQDNHHQRTNYLTGDGGGGRNNNTDPYHKLSAHDRGVVTTDTTKYSTIIDGLKPFTEYTVRVSAITINGSGVPSEWFASKTFKFDLKENQVPDEPSYLRLRALPGGTEIYVEWASPSLTIPQPQHHYSSMVGSSFENLPEESISSAVLVRGYTLGYGIGVPDIFSRVLPPHTTKYTLTDLQPGSEYVISIRAFNNRGNGRERLETVKTLPKQNHHLQRHKSKHWEHEGGRYWLISTPSSSDEQFSEDLESEIKVILPPIGLKAVTLSDTSIQLSWEIGDFDDNVKKRRYPSPHSHDDPSREDSMENLLKQSPPYKPIFKGNHHQQHSITTVVYTIRFRASMPTSSNRFGGQETEREEEYREDDDYFDGNFGQDDVLYEGSFRRDNNEGNDDEDSNASSRNKLPGNGKKRFLAPLDLEDSSTYVRNKYRYTNVTNSDKTAIVTGLKPNTQYEFAVKAAILLVIEQQQPSLVRDSRNSAQRNSIGTTKKTVISRSTWSLSTFNNTFEAAPDTSPRDLTIFGLDPELQNPPSNDRMRTDKIRRNCCSVFVNWQPPRVPNGKMTGYLIYYTTQANRPDREWVVESVRGNQLTTLIRDLTPNTPYHFKIQARNSRGFGPVSPVVYFKTPRLPPPPTVIHSSSPSAGAAKVLFQAASKSKDTKINLRLYHPANAKNRKKDTVGSYKNSRHGSSIFDDSSKSNVMPTYQRRTLYVISAIVAGCLLVFLLAGIFLLILINRRKKTRLGNSRQKRHQTNHLLIGTASALPDLSPSSTDGGVASSHKYAPVGGFINNPRARLAGIGGLADESLPRLLATSIPEKLSPVITDNLLLSTTTVKKPATHSTFLQSPYHHRVKQTTNSKTSGIKQMISNTCGSYGVDGGSKLAVTSKCNFKVTAAGRIHESDGNATCNAYYDYDDTHNMPAGAELGDDELSSIYQTDDLFLAKNACGNAALRSFNGTTSGYGSLKIPSSASKRHQQREPNLPLYSPDPDTMLGGGLRCTNHDERFNCSIPPRKSIFPDDRRYPAEDLEDDDDYCYSDSVSVRFVPHAHQTADAAANSTKNHSRLQNHPCLDGGEKASQKLPPSLLFFRTNSRGCLFDQLGGSSSASTKAASSRIESGVVHIQSSNSSRNNEESCLTTTRTCGAHQIECGVIPSSATAMRTTNEVAATTTTRQNSSNAGAAPAPQSHSDYASGTESWSLKGGSSSNNNHRHRCYCHCGSGGGHDATGNSSVFINGGSVDDSQRVSTNKAQRQCSCCEQPPISSRLHQIQQHNNKDSFINSPSLTNPSTGDDAQMELKSIVSNSTTNTTSGKYKCCGGGSENPENSHLTNNCSSVHQSSCTVNCPHHWHFCHHDKFEKSQTQTIFNFPTPSSHKCCQCLGHDNSINNNEDETNSYSHNGTTTDNDAESSVMLLPPYLPPPPSLLTPLMLQRNDACGAKGHPNICSFSQTNLNPGIEECVQLQHHRYHNHHHRIGNSDINLPTTMAPQNNKNSNFSSNNCEPNKQYHPLQGFQIPGPPTPCNINNSRVN